MNDAQRNSLAGDERRLSAIVFTDVAGYSARMQRDEPGTQQLVRRDFARMRELGAQHGGEVLNTMGDGMLLCFPSAVQAVACALEIQLEFGRRRAQPPAGGALEHRIGIHIGDVVRHEGTVTGDGVNIAARLQTKAPPGGICVSQMVHDTVKGKLPMQAVFLGPEAFKNIAEPIPIYHLAAEGGATVARPSLPVRARSPRRLGLAAAAVVAVAALGGWFWSQRSAPPGAAVAPPSAPPKVSDKSIAVLPFANMSEDKDASAFFSDGIHEDILTNLALVRELHVVSRTSVMAYRTTTKPLRQIAQELGVAYILEGSVRRAGNKVRVTGQLINARTDEHVWAKNYDRDLTDIFALQSELSQAIAAALSAALSPEEKSLLERRPTENLAAYDLYLRARQINREGNDTREEYETQGAMSQSATALDPAFAAAWAELASVHAQMRSNAFDVSAARLAQARTAMETARRLDPDNPAVIAGVGNFYYYGLRDYPHALEQFERIIRQWPNDSSGYLLVGYVQRRQGRWRESLANFRHAEQLDPASPDIARNLQLSFRALRHYDEAIIAQTRRVRLLPESLRESFELARLHYFANGSTKEGDELLAGPIAERTKPATAAGYRKFWAATKGDLATATRLEHEFPNEWGDGLGLGRFSVWRSAVVAAVAGDAAGARARAEKESAKMRARLATEPENYLVWANLAMVESMLGHPAEALAAARKSLELLPESRDALTGTTGRWALVVALAWAGEKEAACAELSRLFAEPSNTNVYELKNGPWLAPLKGDPRFEAIVNDPKNNAPLL